MQMLIEFSDDFQRLADSVPRCKKISDPFDDPFWPDKGLTIFITHAYRISGTCYEHRINSPFKSNAKV